MSNSFKKVLIGSSVFLLLLLGALSFFYFSSYKVMSKKYIDYLQKVTDTLKDNESLNIKINELVKNVFVLQSDKKKLLDELSKKEIQIIYKEKIIYKEGQLVIPDDYVELKDDYVVLSGIYQEKSSMYSLLKTQSDIDFSTINDLLVSVDDLQKKNDELEVLLKQKIAMPVPFFQQAISAGLGFVTAGGNQIDIGYQAIFMNKYTGQIILEYPLSVKFLVGVKL